VIDFTVQCIASDMHNYSSVEAVLQLMLETIISLLEAIQISSYFQKFNKYLY